MRSAMPGIYGLLGVKRDIPAIYHGIADTNVALDPMKMLMRREKSSLPSTSPAFACPDCSVASRFRA